MKLTVSQKIVLGLVVILLLCVLIVWAALRKPLEHKKVFAMSSLVLRHKKGLRCCVKESQALGRVV
jgi:CHASE3 domain sensor protein